MNFTSQFFSFFAITLIFAIGTTHAMDMDTDDRPQTPPSITTNRFVPEGPCKENKYIRFTQENDPTYQFDRRSLLKMSQKKFGKQPVLAKTH